MDSCVAVEKEIDKILGKFTNTHANTSRELEEIGLYMEGLRREICECRCLLVFLLNIMFSQLKGMF